MTEKWTSELVPDAPWTCQFCGHEVGAFKLFDGRLIGFACIRSALREAETQLIEGAYDEHVHLRDVE